MEYWYADNYYQPFRFCNMYRELNGTNVEAHRNKETGLYDISAVATMPDGGPEAPVEFACELRLPDANYTVRREAVFYPGTCTCIFVIFHHLLFRFYTKYLFAVPELNTINFRIRNIFSCFVN